jgi:hypothetical protein
MALQYTSATTIIYNNLSNGGIIHRTSGFVQLIASQETDKREGLWGGRGTLNRFACNPTSGPTLGHGPKSGTQPQIWDTAWRSPAGRRGFRKIMIIA